MVSSLGPLRPRGPLAGGQLQDTRELEGSSRADVFSAAHGSLTHASPSAGAPRRAGRSGWRDPPVVSAPGGLRARAASVSHSLRLCLRGLSASLLPAALPAGAATLRPGPGRRLSAPRRRPLRRPSAPGAAAAPAGRLGRTPRGRPRPRRAARFAGATRPSPGSRPSPRLRRRGAPAPEQPGRRRARPGRCSPRSSRTGGAARSGGAAGKPRVSHGGSGCAAI